MVNRYPFFLFLALCVGVGAWAGPVRADGDAGVSAKDDPRKETRKVDTDEAREDDDERDDDDAEAKRKEPRKKKKKPARLKNKRAKTDARKSDASKRGKTTRKTGDSRKQKKVRGAGARSKAKRKGKVNRKVPKKKPVKKPVKKPKKKKKPREEPLPYGLGLKVGVMPYNSMEAYVSEEGKTDYDMRMAYGYGLGGQIRIMQSFYLTGELMYWVTEVRSKEGASGAPRETDGLLNLGGGLRLNVYGGDYTNDRVYIKGMVGFTSYIADDANDKTTGGDNRNGVYYGGSLGIEHKLARTLTLYADSGFYWNDFTNPAQGEDEAEFFNWQAAAGFMYHWK